MLRLAALIAAWAVGEPGSAMAQLGSMADPICGLTHINVGLRQPTPGAKTGSAEYDVKAALLYRCLELVQWPSDTLPGGEPTITLGLLGKDPFGESLNSLAGKTVAGRKLVVKKLRGVTEAEHCQLMFVAASESKRMPRILKNVAGYPVLTVGESPGFAVQGGMINLLLVGKHIQLEINPVALEKAGIVMDPRLMSTSSPGPAASLGSEQLTQALGPKQ